MLEQPWLPHYGDIPASIDYPDATMFELFAESCKAHADADAIEFGSRRVRYGELQRSVDSIARALWSIGVRSEDRVGILLPAMPHVAVLVYAANRIGAIVSIYDPDESPLRLAAFVSSFAPHWVAALREDLLGLQEFLRNRVDDGELPRGYVSCAFGDYLSGGQAKKLLRERSRLITRGELREWTGAGDQRVEAAAVFAWNSLRRVGRSALPAHRELRSPDSPAVVVYTSGSHALPRGVVHTDRQMNAAALQTHVQGPLLPRQLVAGVLPLSHGFGLSALLHAPLTAGARTAFHPYASASSFAQLIRRRRPEFLIAAPPTYSAVLDERGFKRARYNNLMGAFSGGSRLPLAVRRQFESIVRSRGGAVTIREGYGLSETVAACATEPDSGGRAGSVGIPYPDTYIGIVARRADLTSVGAPTSPFVASGELGEIVVSGPTVMSSYWKDDDATESSLRTDPDGRVWLCTGDLGSMDAEGFLYIVQRRDEADLDIDPSMYRLPGVCESILARQPEVRDVVVADREVQGERVYLAFVVPMDPDMDHEWLGARLAQVVATVDARHRCDLVVFRPALPRTRRGSVDLQGLLRGIGADQWEAARASRVDGRER